MEKLLGDSLVIVYCIAAMGVISYNNFNVSQKIMIIYTFTYLSCFLNTLGNFEAITIATIFTFVYFEYLTEDAYKLKIIKKISYKIIDFVYLIFFQYQYMLFLISMVLQSDYMKSIIVVPYWMEGCSICSLIVLILCVHNVSVQKFQISTVDKIMKHINENPIYKFPYEKIEFVLYDILTEIEDKSYFCRENTYNFLSFEFISYRLKRFRYAIVGLRLRSRIKASAKVIKKYIVKTKHIRGYSTLEMQLIRNIGIENGYNCTFRRKVFELVYTKIFFSSLKLYFNDNYYTNTDRFKEYLIWVYFRCVKSRINEIDVKPVCNAFSTKEMENWSKEGFFIACMGLSHRGIDWYYDAPYLDIVDRYDLDIKSINKLYHNFDKKKLE